MGRKNTFSIFFFPEEALSEEQLVGKTEEEVIGKKVYQKIVSSDTKAFPGQTDAKVQICLQSQTSCRLETSMGDYVAAVTVAVAAYRRRKQRIKNVNKLALVLGLLDEKDAIVSREHICSLCNVRRAPVTSSIYIIRCRWRPLAQYCLHGMLRPSSCIRVVVQARND